MKEIRILVVFTGGTIGSALESGAIRPAGEKARKLLLAHFAEERQKACEEYFGRRISFDTACPYEILSENLSGGHLEKLEECIREKGVENYEGIVVTTGTDTLAYSSAAMGYAFADLQIPVVMVSANYPLSDERSNGFSNFEGALLLILSGGHKGVFCSYDNGDRHFIHYATRLLPQMNYSHRVESVMGKVYGRITGTSLERTDLGQENQAKERQKGNREEPWVDKREVKREEEKEEEDVVLSCKNLAKQKVCFIRPYPGIVYEAPRDCACVLLDTYHSGTLPVMERGFQSFLTEMQKKKIPVFAAGVPKGLVYETVELMRKSGVVILPPASPAAMYMKLWMALESGPDYSGLIETVFQNRGHDLDF